MAHLTRPNAPAPRRSAFTLIELLVVVSIIALLIGILLPTLGEARRQAGIVACVATIRSNSQGVAAYTADNRDRLPTAPPGNGGAGNGPTTGPRGKPAIAFANALDGGVNGWRFSPAERPRGVEYTTQPNAQAVTRLGIEAYWFIAFGNYMSEGRGDAMLAEPFVSPSDRGTRSTWNAYKTVPFDDRVSDPDQTGKYLVPATYWYVLPALYSQEVFDLDGPLSDQGGTGALQSLSSVRAFNRTNSIQFTSNKVAFYQYRVTHDRGFDGYFWNQPISAKGASISIAMFDGSAKNVSVYDEGEVFQPRDDLDQETGPVRVAPAALATGYTSGGPQYFRFTFGGLGGRDVP